MLDSHSHLKSTNKLQRNRKYVDDGRRFDRPHPVNAPRWAYKEQQNVPFDTDIEQTADEVEEVEEEVVGEGQAPTTGKNSDSENLTMDDGF